MRPKGRGSERAEIALVPLGGERVSPRAAGPPGPSLVGLRGLVAGGDDQRADGRGPARLDRSPDGPGDRRLHGDHRRLEAAEAAAQAAQKQVQAAQKQAQAAQKQAAAGSEPRPRPRPAPGRGVAPPGRSRAATSARRRQETAAFQAIRAPGIQKGLGDQGSERITVSRAPAGRIAD